MFTPLIQLDNIRDAEVLEYIFRYSEELYPNIQIDDEGETYREPSIAPYRFIARYNEKKIVESRPIPYLQDKFSFNEYMSNSIPKLLKKLGLDEDKFWYLIRFLYDYAYGYCVVGRPLGESPKEQLEHFCNTFKQYPFMYIELRDGKHNLNYKLGEINNLELLHAFHNYCTQLLKEGKYTTYGDIKDNKEVAFGFFTYYMHKLLKGFFIFMGMASKRKLSSGEEQVVLKANANQLITHILTLGRFLQEGDKEENLKKLIQRCSKLDDGNRVNGIYFGD